MINKPVTPDDLFVKTEIELTEDDVLQWNAMIKKHWDNDKMLSKFGPREVEAYCSDNRLDSTKFLNKKYLEKIRELYRPHWDTTFDGFNNFYFWKKK